MYVPDTSHLASGTNASAWGYSADAVARRHYAPLFPRSSGDSTSSTNSTTTDSTAASPKTSTTLSKQAWNIVAYVLFTLVLAIGMYSLKDRPCSTEVRGELRPAAFLYALRNCSCSSPAICYRPFAEVGA
ncbi:hypothetical protein GQ54DRAFT_304230 [Martensiomyces pterosporus]|nr:hypothetical protein GQ54DRAFT_304230 [Martensiomyces pterosporus]